MYASKLLSESKLSLVSVNPDTTTTKDQPPIVKNVPKIAKNGNKFTKKTNKMLFFKLKKFFLVQVTKGALNANPNETEY